MSVKRKLMLFVPTSISIKLNLTVPSYQWQAVNFTSKGSSIVLRAASWVSLHGAFSVHVFHLPVRKVDHVDRRPEQEFF